MCAHSYLFCGCRAQKEISDIIVQDFTDISKNCIKFEQSSDFKTRKLGSNFKFIDREGAFILGEEFCEPFRIFLYKRPPNAIDRFFLYDAPSARFEHDIWLSAAKPIGPRPLSLAVGNEISSMISEGIVADGNYSNTSLRKGLSGRLGFAHVPPVLIDLAVGHFNSKSDQSSAAFTSIPNLPMYLSVWKQTLTRKKIHFFCSLQICHRMILILRITFMKLTPTFSPVTIIYRSTMLLFQIQSFSLTETMLKHLKTIVCYHWNKHLLLKPIQVF